MAKECTCGQCGEVSHKVIKLSGLKTSTLYLCNPQKRSVQRWMVDGCQIIVGKRCDWLVCVHDSIGTEEIFVELKGADFHGAIQQLEATLIQLRCRHTSKRPRCLAVLTRCPMNGSDVAIEQKRFKAKHNAKLLPLRDKGSHPLRDE